MDQDRGPLARRRTTVVVPSVFTLAGSMARLSLHPWARRVPVVVDFVVIVIGELAAFGPVEVRNIIR